MKRGMHGWCNLLLLGVDAVMRLAVIALAAIYITKYIYAVYNNIYTICDLAITAGQTALKEELEKPVTMFTYTDEKEL